MVNLCSNHEESLSSTESNKGSTKVTNKKVYTKCQYQEKNMIVRSNISIKLKRQQLVDANYMVELNIQDIISKGRYRYACEM